MTPFETLAEQYDRATAFFVAQDYTTAAQLLGPVVDAEPANLAARLLLARALYHSAQLARAERELREIVARCPADDYAHLMLGRVLQRQNRPAEAAGHLRLHAAMTGEPQAA